MLPRTWLTWAQIMTETESANRNTVDTMTSTDRCGPRLCRTNELKDPAANKYRSDISNSEVFKSIWIPTLRKERRDSHIFMFCTFFSRKWGISDFFALRAEVMWLKYLANKSLYQGGKTWTSSVNRHYVQWMYGWVFSSIDIDFILEYWLYLYVPVLQNIVKEIRWTFSVYI